MALFKTGAIVTDVKGKSGGTLFNNGKYGPYISNQSRKVGNAQFQNQQQRGRYRQVANLWSSLTAEQRQSWVEGARQETYVDKLGNVRHYQPRELFFERNLNLAIVDQPMVIIFNNNYSYSYRVTANLSIIDYSSSLINSLYTYTPNNQTQLTAVFSVYLNQRLINYTNRPVQTEIGDSDMVLDRFEAFSKFQSLFNVNIGDVVNSELYVTYTSSGQRYLLNEGNIVVQQ